MALDLFIIGVCIYSAWNSRVRETRVQMQQDLRTLSILVNEEIKSAFHLLKVTQPRLAGILLRSSDISGSSAIIAILRSSMEQDGPNNTEEQSRRLLLIDPSGQLIAQSGEPSPQRLNFSDHYFFKVLRDNPVKQFTVGDLRLAPGAPDAQGSGKPVLHAAIPMRDSRNRLLGVLALQLDAQKIETELKPILNDPKERLIVQLPDGNVVFQYPLFPLPDAANPYLVGKSGLVPKESAHQGVEEPYRLSGADHEGATCVITLPLDSYGLSTSVLIPERQILSLFFKQNFRLFLFTLITIVLIVLLFAGLRRQSENLEKALLDSITDFNTGLKNRRALEEELSRLLPQALRMNTPLSVLFIDIDHFKSFNDLNGHDLGDRVLRNVAQCIANFSRRPLDYCCRWGGEEFVMVLPETNEEEAVIMANKVKESVEKMEIEEMRLTLHEQITLSIGIATTRSCPNPTPEALIKLADQAMLRAKMEGRNRIVLL